MVGREEGGGRKGGSDSEGSRQEKMGRRESEGGRQGEMGGRESEGSRQEKMGGREDGREVGLEVR